MRPIVNMPEKDRATDIGNMHKNLVKIARVLPEISCRTDRQTDALFTILRNTSQYLTVEAASCVLYYVYYTVMSCILLRTENDTSSALNVACQRLLFTMPRCI